MNFGLALSLAFMGGGTWRNKESSRMVVAEEDVSSGGDDELDPWVIPTVAAVSAFVVVCCFFSILCHVTKHRRREKHARKTLKDLFHYLHRLQVEDIDIRRSPAG